MRVFTARFLLGSLVVASICVIVSPAEAGPFRRRGARGAAPCCPDASTTTTAYSGTGYGYAPAPCCPGAAPVAYGSTSYYQPGNLIPAGGVPMPLPIPGAGSPLPNDAVPANVEKVKILDGTFEPATLTITLGTAVRWTNDGKKPHTVTSEKGDWGSPEIPPGGDFTATFTKPGTFEYHCKLHKDKDMKATIIVK
jgi:plastocyanin